MKKNESEYFLKLHSWIWILFHLFEYFVEDLRELMKKIKETLRRQIILWQEKRQIAD